MSANHNIPKEIAPYEATLDAPPDLATLTEGTSSHGSGPRVHFVEGSGPGMSCETRDVLRGRLRMSALLMCLGFTVFWLWWTWGVYTQGFQTFQMWSLYGLQFFTGLVLGVIGLTLYRSCRIPIFRLRMYEAVIFGLPATFFICKQVFKMPVCAEEHGFVATPVVPWMMLIFVYALFIPNTWRRAAVIIGSMAAAPVIAAAVMAQICPHCHGALAVQDGFYVEMVISLALAAVSAVAGVHTIGTLRREAFKAKQLGQYNLRHLIGAGGMGEVYLAEHRLLKRPCAIKLIRPDKAGDDKTLKRFEREVRASAKLSHWNSIEIFDYGHADDGTFYYVMEFLPGMNLQEIVQRYGPLPPQRVVHLMTQTCDALSEAHEAGLLHRDVKPANIFAAHRGGRYDVAKLLDFGLVKPLTEMDSSQLTQEGSITGSPLYMSPEQTTGDSEPDARSDIYCLGAVAYFLLTGRPPFNYDQPIKVLLAHANETPQPPSELQPNIPADVEAVVLRCLAKNPEDRFADVLQMRDALMACESAGQWSRDQAATWWQEHDHVAEPAEPVLV